MTGYSRWGDDPYYLTDEEERELEERAQEEAEIAERARIEEQDAAEWLASRPWWWHSYKSLAWRFYWGPRRWLLTNTAWGRRYVDWKIDRDYARRGLHNLRTANRRYQAIVPNDEVPF